MVDTTHKTVSFKRDEITRRWYLVDAEGKILGRLASTVATILRGKNKVTYTPHVDTGDHVIIVNAEKIRLTGDKLHKKTYIHHTEYPGGLRSTSARELLRKRPERVLFFAVQGMLPKNKLGRAMIKKLRVYKGPDHPHQAQQPERLDCAPAERG